MTTDRPTTDPTRAALERIVNEEWSEYVDHLVAGTTPSLVLDYILRDLRAALAHPTLARVIAIGQAWVAAEEAVLGRGAGIEMTVRTLPGAGAVASWYDRVDGEGDRLPSEPTPEAALLALAAALTDQERGS